MVVSLKDPRVAVWAHHRCPYVRIALIAAAIHLLLFVLTPPFQFKPYKLEEPEFMVVQNVPDFRIPEPVKEVPKPPVVITAHEEEGVDDPDVGPTTFYGDEPPPPPPSKTGATSVYVAYDMQPEPIHFEIPEYPELAREAGIEGVVQVRVVIDKEGTVVGAVVLFSDVTPSMERAALDAAYRCRFRPARQGNVPVRVTIVIPFEFRLTR
jgi:protein TonB